MKKLVSILLSTALVFALVSCTDSAQTVETSASQTAVLQVRPAIYSLDGMSAPDIVSAIISISTGVSAGDTTDTYSAKFLAEPIDFYTDNLRFGYTFDSSDSAYIASVECYIQREADGTLTLSDDSAVAVTAILTEDVASDVYASLYDYLCETAPGETSDASSDIRTGSSWKSEVNYLVLQDLGDGSEFFATFSWGSLAMKQGEDGRYTLTATLPGVN